MRATVANLIERVTRLAPHKEHRLTCDKPPCARMCYFKT